RNITPRDTAIIIDLIYSSTELTESSPPTNHSPDLPSLTRVRLIDPQSDTTSHQSSANMEEKTVGNHILIVIRLLPGLNYTVSPYYKRPGRFSGDGFSRRKVVSKYDMMIIL